MKTKFIIICLAYTLTSCHSGNHNFPKNTNTVTPQVTDQDSLEFINAWNKFCDYLSVCDTNGAKSILSFPLKTRGVLDSDPYMSYTEKDYMIPITLFFKQQIDAIPCEEDFDGKLKKFRMSNLFPSYNGNNARIGDAVFEKTDGKWKINFMYIDTEGMVYRGGFNPGSN